VGIPYLYAPQRVLQAFDFLETALAALGRIGSGPITLFGGGGWMLPGGIQYLEATLLLSKLSSEEAKVLTLYCGDRLDINHISKLLNIPGETVDELLTEGALNFYDLKWGHGNSGKGN